MKTKLASLFLAASFALPSMAGAAASKPPATPAKEQSPPPPQPAAAVPVIRVNSTNQPFDFARPWDKKPPYLRRGTGAILEGGRVLVTAELVADNTYIELEKTDSGEKSPATVAAIDYDANLALLVPSEKDFLDGLGTLALDLSAKVGTRAEILQVESNGDILRTPATLTTISVVPYPMESISLLSFRLSAPLQTRDNSFILPAVSDGKLLGLLMRYDSRSQSADLVPAPVIAKFLENGAHAKKFPRAGLGFASTRDPQFRGYIGLGEKEGGVYVTFVQEGSPAEKAGLERGDVIVAADGRPIDPDGLYEDPSLGKISFTHLISMSGGKPLKLDVLRGGSRFPLEVAPEPTDPARVVSAPYLFDEGPNFFVLGGLVFQELNRTYLQQWGGNWRKTAPQRLVYLDAFQEDIPGKAENKRIVFLSSVLPSPDTIGYEDLENLVVTKINGIPIKNLSDLAAAAEKPLGGFHKIEFEEDPGAIYLDAASVEANSAPLAEHYSLPQLKRIR